MAHEFLIEGARAHLEKPITLDDLRRGVAEILADLMDAP